VLADRSSQLRADLATARRLLAREVEATQLAAKLWADHQELTELLPPLLASAAGSPARAEIVRQLRVQLSTSQPLDGLQDFRVLGRDGSVLAAQDEAAIGSSPALPLTPQQWAAAWRGESIHSTVETTPTAASLYVLAPLRAAADAPVGALLVFRIDASQKLDALFDLTRKEARGETYAFNRLGVLINPSRFEDDLRQSGRLATAQSAARTLRLTAPETPEQLTLAVATAVRGESGVRTAPYPNYRGEPVLGAWTWLADLDLGLVTEVDAAESLRVLHQQQQILLLSALLCTASVLALILYFYLYGRRLARSEKQLLEVNSTLEQRVQRRTAELEALSSQLQQKLVFQNTLVETLPTPMFVLNAERCVTVCNPAYRQAFGELTLPASGLPLTEFLQQLRGNTDALTADVQMVLTRGSSIHRQIQLYNRRGAARDFLIWLSPLRNAAGAPEGLIAALVDVSDRLQAQRKAEATQKLLQDITDGVPGAVYQYLQPADGPPRFGFVSGGCEELLGVPADVLLDNYQAAFAAVVAEDQVLIQKAIAESLATGAPWLCEFRIHHRKQGLRWVRGMAHLQRQEDGSAVWHGLFTDLTDRKELELALSRARDQAESATRAKSDFLATMSHEIRTPMNGVVGIADLLAQTPLDSEQERMLATMRESANALLTLLNDILDFSKIEAGKLSLETLPVSLRELADGITESLGLSAVRKGLRLLTRVAPNTPRGLATDPVRLRQILTNLIGNAIKFTERGAVRVDVQPLEAEGNVQWMRFSVRDDGIGMSEDQQAALFQPFAQAESSTSRRFGGTGLGLSIVKQLVEMMGGRISLRSALGQGACFSVDLPMALADGDPAPDEVRLDGVTVLIADPEREQGQIVADYSRDAGAEAATFATAAALLSLLPQVLGSGAAVVVYLSHQLSDDEVRGLIAQASSGAVHAQLRFVAERRFDAEGIRLSNVVSLAADPLIRSSLLLALGTAAGRASPAVAQPKFFAASTAPRALESPDEAERNGRLILVAEDNFTNQEVIRRQLGLLGYTSEMVENGEQALQELGRRRYACLLTDCHMPVMDGYALARAVRAREQTSGTAIYIIAITANALQGEADRCREAGMDYYLSKPLDLRKLKHLLEGILPPPATPEVSPERPAFDAQVLRELIGDDPDSVREILGGFAPPALESLQQIQAALAVGDLTAAGGEAHKLKSSARAIGAFVLAEHCLAMEQAAKAGRLDSAQASGTQLASELHRVAHAIQAQLNPPRA